MTFPRPGMAFAARAQTPKTVVPTEGVPASPQETVVVPYERFKERRERLQRVNADLARHDLVSRIEADLASRGDAEVETAPVTKKSLEDTW